MNEPLQLEAGLPPHVTTEKCVLGAILLDASALEQIEGRIHAEDFSLDSHRRIYVRMCELARTGHPIDIITLAHVLNKHNEVEQIGGIAYIASLTEGLPRRPVISEYVSILKDKGILRRMMQACSIAMQKAETATDGGMELLSATLNDLSNIEASTMEGADLESVGQWLDRNDVFAERRAGIFTGIDDYDELTFGLHNGELTVFAGRTSMGKTSHCGTIAWQIGVRGKNVAVFLNEQRKASFIGRMLCGRSGVSFKSYREGRLDWVERQYIEESVREFKTLPIYIDQRASMSVGSIRSKAARLKRSDELDVILIDQLSRINSEGIYQKGMRGDELIGEKVSAIKGIAVDLDVPVGLYHQLNRETTKNDEGRPTLSNLKNSGAIEEHADNVALFHRPGYYKRDDTKKNDAEIILAKQRDGETGTVPCEFIGYNCRWQNRSK